MTAVHRLSSNHSNVPVEVLAVDIFRIARSVYNDPTIRGKKRQRAVIEERMYSLYPDVTQDRFIAALNYLTQFLHE